MEKKETKSRVLIVDDIPENIKIIGETLKNDFNVLVATSGAEAIDIAMKKSPPDLILLDIMMPEMDGYEVCSRLKSYIQTRNIPIIFLTAMDDDIDEVKGFNLGAVDYITKPFSPAIVKARIKTHLELKRLREDLEEIVRDRTNEMLNIFREKRNARQQDDNEEDIEDN